MFFIQTGDQWIIEENLLAFRCRHSMLLPIPKQVSFVPIKTLPIQKYILSTHDICILLPYTYVKHILSLLMRCGPSRIFSVIRLIRLSLSKDLVTFVPLYTYSSE